MFKGRGKIWVGSDGTVTGEMDVDTPAGNLTFRRSAQPLDVVQGWDPTSDGGPVELVKKKMEYIAGFFPLTEIVGDESLGEANSLAKGLLDDETKASTLELINDIKARAASGDDKAYDVDYAFRRIMAIAKKAQKAQQPQDDFETLDSMYIGDYEGKTEIGARPFKKLAKWAKKNPVKAAVSVAMPPVAAFNLVKEARKNKKAANKVKHLRRLAAGVPPLPGAPVPSEAVIEQAQNAVENLRTADSVLNELPPEEVESFDPQEYDEYQPDEDYVGGLSLKSLKRYVDPTTKEGAWLRSASKSIPVVGPGVSASLELVVKAKEGDRAAKEKLNTIKQLSDAGVAKAEAAQQNIQTANKIIDAAEKRESGFWAWVKRLFGIR